MMMSSDRELTKGMIITPMTTPAASADSELTLKPRLWPISRTNGAMVNAAKKP